MVPDRLANIHSGIKRIHTTNVWLWIIILMGFALRVYHLGFRPLWDDEAFTVLIMASDIRQIALAAVRDTFPPLHYYILNLMMMTMGWSEFAIRYASLTGSVLAIPVMHQLGKRLVNRQVGLWAALVMAFSPFSVYFAQEARAYSWMVLTSLFSVYAFARVISSLSTEGRASLGRWAVFSCASAAMLYTHFLSLWVLVVEGLYFLWFWLKRRRGFRAWAGAHIAIGFLFLPWLLLMLGIGAGGDGKGHAGVRQLGGTETDAPIASLLWIWQEGRTTHGAVSLADTLRQALVSFTIGDFVPSSWELVLALGFALIALLGLVGLILQQAQERISDEEEHPRAFPYPILFLLLYTLLPVLLSYFVAFPTSRPHWAKYFMMALPAYMLLVGIGLACLRKWQWVLAILGAGFVIGASMFTLYNYFENPVYARADIRPGVRYLEAFSSPNDALLINPPRSSSPFWYYFHGELPHYSPDQIDEPRLKEIADGHAGLWVVQNRPVGFDPDQEIESWLTHHTYRTFTDWVGQLTFRYYSMPSKTGQILQEDFEQPVFFGDSVALQGYQLGVRTSGRAQVVQLDLVWEARTDMDEDYMVGARAVDGEGRVWGQTNSAPLGNFRPTASWQPGEIVPDHLGLLLWPGTPPGKYSVQIWMYRESDGTLLPISVGGSAETQERLGLAEVHVEAPQYPPNYAMLGLEIPLDMAFDGLLLLGYQATGTQVKPGEDLGLVLFWQSTRADLSGYVASLSLEDTKGQRWNEERVAIGGSYPTDQWSTGQVVRHPHTFSLPPDVPDGAYEIKLQVADSTGEPGTTATLMALDIKSRVKRFDLPRIDHPQKANLAHQVEFLGYDLPVTWVSAGETLSLTLYWRALSPMDTSYTVFNHLVGPGDEILGQRDAIPIQGTLPTTEWVIGEVIKDVHHIPVREDAAPGTSSRLIIGLYDPATGQRLDVVESEDQEAANSIQLESLVEIR